MKKTTGMTGKSGRGRNRRSVTRSIGPSVIAERPDRSLTLGEWQTLARTVFSCEVVIKDPRMTQEVKNQQDVRDHTGTDSNAVSIADTMPWNRRTACAALTSRVLRNVTS